ncbi:hybrid sensor histidine kinase/response regulator [Herbaspirillum sp.]|uniref:hybrid sensor histidine kinase/response regulator n=1 Tax=Herbaspirillum sp. TaxID=1890675 RepID=UPI0031D7D5ED
MQNLLRWWFVALLWAVLAWPAGAAQADAKAGAEVDTKAGAKASARATVPPPIDLARVAHSMSLTEHLLVLRDDTGRRPLAAVMASGLWKLSGRPMLHEGYSESAFWLRGVMRNDSPVAVTRWLALGSARLQDVQLYVLPTPGLGTGEHARQLPQYAGTLYPLAQREVPARNAVFALTLAPGEQRVVVLRVAGSSVIDLSVALWEPTAFREQEGLELGIQLFVLGVALVLVTYALIQGATWGDHGFALTALWIMMALAFSLSFQGYLYRYLLPDGGPSLVHAPATLGCLATLLYLWMSYALVELNRLRPWIRIYGLLSLVLLVMAGWTAVGDYRQSAPVANACAGLCYLVWLVSMLHGWREGLDNARLLVLSFALAWLGMLLKMLELNRLVERSVLPDWHFITLFQLGLLGVGTSLVVGRALQLRRLYDQMQWAMLYTRAHEQLKLEEAVKQRTDELRKALEAADQANQAKSGFLTRISHDLRTPLTSIIGFADLLQTAGGEHAQRGRIIVRSARHMLEMVNDLIDYLCGDPQEMPHPTPLYAHALLHDIGQQGKALARRQRNSFRLQVSPTLPPVLQIDGRRLRRVLGNLLDNAAKYTSEGDIVLTVDWAEGADPGMGVIGMQVIDNGRGIPLQYQGRVFEPFERANADRDQPGIGMGLAIVRQWVQKMGGQIMLQSQPGQGTVVNVHLPAALAREQDIAPHDSRDGSAEHPCIDGNGRLVLVVEDSPEIAALLVEQLDSVGFRVELYKDGQSVMARMAHGQNAPPSLLVTDYLLPDSRGDEILFAARQYLPGVPVLLLSATLRQESDKPEDQEFDAHLLKPVNFTELQENVARLLRMPPLQSEDPNAMDSLMSPTPPPPESVQKALDLIALGAVSELLEWCDDLLQQHPECEDFVTQAREFLRSGDLFEMEALCQFHLY